MSPLWGQLVGVVTLVLMLVFIGDLGLGVAAVSTSASSTRWRSCRWRMGRTSDERVLVDLGDRAGRRQPRALRCSCSCGDCAWRFRRSPTARAATSGRTAYCAKACGGCRCGGSCSRRIVGRRIRLSRALSRASALRGHARLDLERASSRATRRRTAARRRRCSSASAASRSRPSPPIPRRCASARRAVHRQLRRMPRPRRARQRGARRPDLTDGDWLYGGDGKAILTSILDGRRGVMPPFAERAVPSETIKDIAHYVLKPVGADRRLAARATRQAATTQLRRLPRRRRQGQPRARRAEPDRQHLALRRQPRRHRGDDPQRPQRRDAGMARAAGRGGRHAGRGVGLRAIAPGDRVT